DLRRSAFALDFDDEDWEPIAVPGHWRSTPAFASSDGPLIYRTRFELDPGVDGARHWVVLDGLFYHGHLCLHAPYPPPPPPSSSPHAARVPGLARLGSEHVVAIEVTCAPPGDRTKKRAVTGAFQHSDSLDADWNPGGLWRPVRVERSGPVRIERLRVLCQEVD